MNYGLKNTGMDELRKQADMTRRQIKKRDVVLGIVAVVLLLILTALITNRAFAVNEPPKLIIPQAPHTPRPGCS